MLWSEATFLPRTARRKLGSLPASMHTFFSKKSLRLGAVFCSFLLLAPLSPAQQATSSRLRIVATTGMLGDALRQIAGDRAQVTTLMGPGVDPHSYEPTPGAMRALRGADLIFYNGLHLEGAMHFAPLARRKAVYAASDALAPEDVMVDQHFATGKDPHIWGDVQLWMKVVRYLSACLQQHDPTHAAYYAQRSQAYLKQLAQLDAHILAALAQLPASQRILVTAHDAFGYFGRRYGLQVHALQGISTMMAPGLQDRLRLKDFIIKHGIKTVFTEATVSDKNMRAVMASCRAAGHAVLASAVLFSDSLGAEGTPGGTYIGMMRANTRHIQAGLTL